MFLRAKLKIKFLFIFICGTTIKSKIHFFEIKNSLKPLAKLEVNYNINYQI